MLTAYSNNEKKLLSGIAEGDAAAFARLFYLYKDRVYAVALRICKSDFLAEEVVQEIFMKVWTKRVDLVQIENFGGWINTITRNHLFTILKRKAVLQLKDVELALAEEAGVNDTDQLLLSKETHAMLHKAINRLPSQQHKVYRLIKEEGFKKEEVASYLNLSPETVKIHLTKAIKNIRSYCHTHMDTLLVLLFFPWQ